ncbi:MAG: putative ABC transporter permease [Lachnospiraceae bacterium]|nr:putative ABC transporter permease [Lachnospiraceae bacterium]
MYELMTSPFILGMDFATLTCVMMFYSFIGWFYESTIFSLVEQGKLMNRGCFIGPYLPIYSVVAVLNLYLLDGVDSPFKIVLISALTCCAVEYITSWALEKVFHARYWDYSYFPLNINGRISVVSGAFFGIAILFLIKVLHPFTIVLMNKIPERIRVVLGIFFWVLFLVDAILTVIGMCNLNRKCKEIYDAIDRNIEAGFDKMNNKKAYLNRFKIVRGSKELVVKLKGINKKFVSMETRIIEAYPDFHSYSYAEILDKMKETLARKRRGSKIKVIEEMDEEFERESENGEENDSQTDIEIEKNA